MSVYSLPGYDAWATAGPPEYDWVCPECGGTDDDMEELPVIGLKHGVVYKCPCGALLSDDALVKAQDYNRP